jgi:hypothetical protein
MDFRFLVQFSTLLQFLPHFDASSIRVENSFGRDFLTLQILSSFKIFVVFMAIELLTLFLEAIPYVHFMPLIS